MNQRMGHRTGNSTMLSGQCVKRRNGGRVAQHYGDLPTLGAVSVLPAGLLVSHSEKPKLTASHVGHDDDGLRANGKHRVLQNAGIAGVHGCGNRGGFVVGHGASRSGPIPPMGESSHVTSDTSTPSGKDFLEAA